MESLEPMEEIETNRLPGRNPLSNLKKRENRKKHELLMEKDPKATKITI